MKTHLAKVSLALLSTVFLFGCQDQGSGPVGPEGTGIQAARGGEKGKPDKPGSGGGNAVAAKLNLADGMLTTELDVTVRANKLGAGNTDFDHPITMNFENPGDCFGFKGTKSGKVPEDDEIVKLVAELTSLVTDGFFTMQIDKTGLTVGGSTTSEGHLLLVERDGTFDDAPGTTHGNTRIMLGGPFNQVDPVTVKWVSQDVFTFTGPVVVWAHGVGGGGGEKSNRIIACDGAVNLDGNLLPDPNKVTATINR